MDVAKVFWSGRSQAVRLPREYRVDGTEVRIRRHGSAIILEPIPANWDWLDEVMNPLDEDFVAGALEKQEHQERPELDLL